MGTAGTKRITKRKKQRERENHSAPKLSDNNLALLSTSSSLCIQQETDCQWAVYVFDILRRVKMLLAFSLRCSTRTTIPNPSIAVNNTTVTQGIQSPGFKYNSFLHSPTSPPPLSSFDWYGRIKTWEFGMTPSKLMKCWDWFERVEPMKRFST